MWDIRPHCHRMTASVQLLEYSKPCDSGPVFDSGKGRVTPHCSALEVNLENGRVAPTYNCFSVPVLANFLKVARVGQGNDSPRIPTRQRVWQKNDSRLLQQSDRVRSNLSPGQLRPAPAHAPIAENHQKVCRPPDSAKTIVKPSGRMYCLRSRKLFPPEEPASAQHCFHRSSGAISLSYKQLRRRSPAPPW